MVLQSFTEKETEVHKGQVIDGVKVPTQVPIPGQLPFPSVKSTSVVLAKVFILLIRKKQQQ